MSNHVTIIKFYNNETLKHFIFYFHIKNSNIYPEKETTSNTCTA